MDLENFSLSLIFDINNQKVIQSYIFYSVFFLAFSFFSIYLTEKLVVLQKERILGSWKRQEIAKLSIHSTDTFSLRILFYLHLYYILFSLNLLSLFKNFTFSAQSYARKPFHWRTQFYIVTLQRHQLITY